MLVWLLRSLYNRSINLGLLSFFGSKRKAPDQGLSEAIRNIFGYSPKNVSIYKLAFKHKSAAVTINNGFRHCNERLEYLGDAVLGSVVADFLFKKFPFKDEGFLTEMRSRIVSRSNLNMLSRKMGLDQLVEAGKDGNSTGSSIMGDAFEALIGAIYLDKGYVFTKNIIVRKIIQTHLDVDALMAHDINFKSKIIEWAQKEKKAVSFNLVGESDNRKKGKLYTIELVIDAQVLGRAQDFSIKKAEQSASRQAWERISQLAENG